MRVKLSEAWFLTLHDLAKFVAGNQVSSGQAIRELLAETCTSAVTFPFFSTRSNTMFMSVDGPHTLAWNDFLESAFLLGMMEEIAQELYRRVPLDSAHASTVNGDVGCQSVAIIAAALFRAYSLAFPPYAIEAAPSLYASLFTALGKDSTAFGHILKLSMEVKASAHGFGSVRPGERLSGPLFDSTTEKSKETFLKQAMELFRQDDLAAWRRVKVLVKQITGGKKKDSDFSQKPSPTNWTFERI